MSEIIDNTFSAYLGHEFQQKLMWQLLVEPEFAERTIPKLAIEYFDDPNLKRLFVIMLEFINEFEKVPNLQNKSIQQAINSFKIPNNPIEEEALFATIRRIELWNERVLNKQMLHDGEVVQKATIEFIKQQEYRKMGEFILEKTKNGEIKNKKTINYIEDNFLKISEIGNEDETSEEISDNIERSLRENFRETIPTGIDVLDTLTGGGLGKSEMGLILAPLGTGKSTLLTKIANTGYEVGKNIAHIIFEDNIDDIKRKHYTIWSKIPLSKLDKNKNYVIQVANEKTKVLNKYGRLVIKRFSDDGTTILDIRNWLLSYQKKNGFKFEEIVLDYLDCLESHKRTSDQNHNEFVIVKGFNALISELNIPGWSAIQSNRQGIESEIVEAYQMGGNIKRAQKAHFLMSIAKIEEQKLADLATIKIIKSRFVKDGYVFKDCIFNNDTLEIKIEDDRFKNVTSFVKNKKRELSEKTNTVDDIKEKSSDLSIHNKINEYTQELVINDNLVQINNNIVLDDNIQNIEPIINNNDINIEAIRRDIIKKGMIRIEENIDKIKHDGDEQTITNNNEPIEFIDDNKQTNNENNHTPSILEILSKKRETQKVIKENDKN